MVQAAVVLLAVVVALAPRPSDLVERYYAAAVYPALHAAVTTASNAVPFSLFDVVLVAALVVGLWRWTHALRQAHRARAFAPVWRAARVTATVAAAAYLWFVAIWGLNYARPPLDARLGLPAAPATADEVSALLDEAVGETNRRYRPPSSEGYVRYVAELDVARTLNTVEGTIFGRTRATVPGRPKSTVLAPYFRMAGVDGLTAPAALETLLNPDLTDAERPFALAHEWAHLSGFAAEADANFVAWLATTYTTADRRSRYSGWLFLVIETSAQVPRDARRAALERLDEGPRRDLDAIAARARQRIDLVQRVGWRVYDQYLRSQGVREGIVSYSRVVDLIARASRQARLNAPSVPMPQ